MNITAIGGGNKEPAIRAALENLPVQNPTVLLVPTACSLKGAYDRKLAATQAFFKDLGVSARVLHEFGVRPTDTQTAHELGQAALIHTIGGNTPHLLSKLKEWELAGPLSDAVRNGTAHTGISAGAGLFFARIHSNPSANPGKMPWDFKYLTGLAVAEGVIAVHANIHDPTPDGFRPDTRLQHLEANFPADVARGLAIDNGAAVQLSPQPQIIRANPEAKVHLLYRTEDNRVESHAITDASELAVLYA